ncbi:ORF3 [alphacoronavirus sp. WA3607]|uniref:ORF3 n=1 Tax=alphacoronavirus sp. WA3607 TaxID=3070155 RepID=A0AA48Z9B8_9ALPC|nr:ORF3 [Alphacoronavirus sp.]QGX41952.1 ORF3 [alphacoronavirus sp. WA3607]
MFLGLFQYSLERAVNNSAMALKLSDHDLNIITAQLTPVSQASSVLGFLLTSIFVVYFALYTALTFKGNCCCLVARVLTLVFYAPLLFFCGAYIDGTIVCVTLVVRFCYTGYFAYRYKTPLFIILNTSLLAFINGKGWYYDRQPFMVLSGGEHFVNFGIHIVPFVVSKDLYVAIRGLHDEDLCLVRCVELINGSFFYIFARDPVVGVVNMNFTEIQLYEDVASLG